MATIAETIADLRAQREANSQNIIAIREQNMALSDRIRKLEASITPPKRARAAASPDDVVMAVEPATASIGGAKG